MFHFDNYQLRKSRIITYILALTTFISAAHAAQFQSQPTKVSVVQAAVYDCALATIHCVGAGKEFANIQAGVNAASAGHTVVVFAGTYAGFYVNKSGTSAQPITIKSSGVVTINQGNSSSGNGIRIENSNYIVIDGFVVNASSFNSAGAYDYNYAGIAARGAPSSGQPMMGIKILNCEVFGANTAGIYLSNTKGTIIENNYLHDIKAVNANTGMGIYVANSGSDNLVIRKNKFHSNAQDGLFANGDSSVSGSDGVVTGLVIESNVFSNNSKNGISFDGGQNITLRNNIFANNGKHAIRGYQSDAAAGPRNLIVINNTMLGNESAFKTTEDLGGHIIFNNLIVQNLDSILSESSQFFQTNNIVGSDPNVHFVNSASGMYSLKQGSSAINAGITSFQGQSAPTVDIVDKIRPSGAAVDVGAYEF